MQTRDLKCVDSLKSLLYVQTVVLLCTCVKLLNVEWRKNRRVWVCGVACLSFDNFRTLCALPVFRSVRKNHFQLVLLVCCTPLLLTPSVLLCSSLRECQ